MKAKVNKYQFVVELPTSLADKDQKATLKTIEEQIVKTGVTVSFKDWGEKELAYAIKGEEKARFWIGEIGVDIDVEMDWNKIKVYLNRDKQILRYLFLKI